MIKRVVLGLVVSCVLFSCNRTYEKAMKSDDPEFILKSANQLFEDQKWQYAIDLYQKISSSYAGKEEAEQIALNSAAANYEDKNYPLAAKQYKNFYIHFNKSDKAEEALYQSAYSYYKGSPEYNLDQKNTYAAIKELQGFIDRFPNSERVAEANKLMNELRQKLERKAFEIAKSYYKTLKYKSAVVNFANFLDDFPDSSYREEAYLNLLKSKAQLAIRSIYSKKALRIKEAKTAYRLFKKAYPESKYSEEAEKWLNRVKEAEKEQEDQAKLIKKLERETKKEKDGL